ncbi:RrF2 family transcriptional regulator [Mucilaginibacter auburnensis]|uniref:Rrf2 family protein n=1 Tax=Mucilaginibacter auburnensis TaxID=1457233 RepID=A0A2H9VTA9_9SPHI|nr:Rrf2 family transcriptional regulator [Mucilaginibacter auburnensis]PJJ84067.1 Rrf2 family protein [Mucilaginibacter auburnensis]
MISKRTKYALNALVFLASKPKDTPIPIPLIAESENISRKFLEAILLELRRGGMVNSKKGKDGGYFLAKSTEEINVADIMRLFDGPIALLPCVTYKYYRRCDECKDEATCGIRKVFAELRAQTVNTLKNATLAEIVRRSETED